MRKLSLSLGIMAALFLSVIFAGLSTSAPIETATSATATSSVATAPAATTTPAQATTTPARSSAPANAKPLTRAPAPAPAPRASLSSVAGPLQGALVNILCVGRVTSGGPARIASGSGVFVDTKGIILTNAHVALHFLLADRGMQCTIRTGSPASNAYLAELVYISPLWLRANADILTKEAPKGTGEYDFALLAVTGSATGGPLPASFPSLPLSIVPPALGTPVAIGSYGAQSLNQKELKSSLLPTLVFGSVRDVFTFGTNTVDVFELVGSAASQEGSSGGGVADASGSLIGTITTSAVEGDISTRSLYALTSSYIRAQYASETGLAIDLLFARPTAASVAAFAPHIRSLESIITKNL